MKRIPLGRGGPEITNYCLGTMTWGRQTPEADAHRQLDMALEAGISILDTAEMYPVNPVMGETIGVTETVIGNWIAKTPSRRGEIAIASKITGQNARFVRPGQDVTGATLREALEGSLERLNTDHIDLYQLHWPNRGSYHFRQNWRYDPSGQDATRVRDNMLDVLQSAQELIAEGKLGQIALSNESTWGTAQWLRLSEEHGLPRVASIQNEYSLLCRLYDTDLAELAVNEDVTLLAFSPVAAGLLTGKYQGGAVPDGSRMSLNAEMGGRKTDRVFTAVAAYLDLAQKHGVDPIHMALAFTVQRPFPVSTIFGATTSEQLAHVLSGLDTVLSDALLSEIDEVHRQHPMPY